MANRLVQTRVSTLGIKSAPVDGSKRKILGETGRELQRVGGVGANGEGKVCRRTIEAASQFLDADWA